MTRPQEFNWCFYKRNNVAFDASGPLKASPDSSMDNPGTLVQPNAEGCASVSDGNGDLVMYTNGADLWDGGHDGSRYSGLGGDVSSTMSAIIVPPPAGKRLYHIFAVRNQKVDSARLTYTSFDPSSQADPSSWAPSAGPTTLAGIGEEKPTERLAATSHCDCERYWVVVQLRDKGAFRIVEVDGDAGPTNVTGFNSQLPWDSDPDPEIAGGVGYMKFSPDGKFLAYVNYYSKEVCLLGFDACDGRLEDIGFFRVEDAGDTSAGAPYGLEFSPDSSRIFVGLHAGRDLKNSIIRQNIPDMQGQPYHEVWSSEAIELGALQLAPDNLIYGARAGEPFLLSLDPVGGAVVEEATDRNGDVLELAGDCGLGLPSFTRIADPCVAKGGCCEEELAKVDDELERRTGAHHETMAHCDGTKGTFPAEARCTRLEMPDIEPSFHITWAQDACDCVESDDVEVMNLTICNPYSNIAMTAIVVSRLEVLNADGSPVALLPDGTPSVGIVPMGPYCFGDIEGCGCVSREFTLRNRGASARQPYHIRVEGVCFGVSTRHKTKGCFQFEICKD